MTRVLAFLTPALLATLALAGCGPKDQPAEAPGGAAGGDPEVAIADVQEIAPALERFVRGTPYPQTLAEAEAAIAEAGLELAPGNRLTTYAYDPEAVEFALCIETEDGAWASYDTAPMSVRGSSTPHPEVFVIVQPARRT